MSSKPLSTATFCALSSTVIKTCPALTQPYKENLVRSLAIWRYVFDHSSDLNARGGHCVRPHEAFKPTLADIRSQYDKACNFRRPNSLRNYE
ncbi:hypothetical protein CROQUDRAFT_92224 [Cronartium quercuum f. sp. fusiforme G11]|uniref:Uncharacterized protein n=1 Tax=Cronartium quercuum f. sp. fusiforme G11 TaxID=708437 RepID=A0A9P6NMA9_9BASI|nr:hypothetical protein CROQUDRAFT_92224 [Cronartium quercuum f. sp. fusiforme G11]